MAELRKVYVFMALLVALFPARARADGDGAVRARKRAMEWQKAAVNRELAALPRAEEADRLHILAVALRARPTESNVERGRNLEKAGDLAMQCGAMEQCAAGSFRAASANWLRSATEYGRAGDSSKRASAMANSTAATESVVAAYNRAAECYEGAASDYAGELVNKTGKSASASDRAAGMREKLASLK